MDDKRLKALIDLADRKSKNIKTVMTKVAKKHHVVIPSLLGKRKHVAFGRLRDYVLFVLRAEDAYAYMNPLSLDAKDQVRVLSLAYDKISQVHDILLMLQHSARSSSDDQILLAGFACLIRPDDYFELPYLQEIYS
jgi:hypothetical protein